MDKSERFSGSGNIEQFLQKVDVHVALKGYDTEEKKAQCLASKLNGAAFDVYMRLPTDEKKVYETVQEELRKEFKKGTTNRESALHQLTEVKYSSGSIMTHAYEVMELVKLAYPGFSEDNQQTVAKDSFLKSLHTEMQVQLKTKYPKLEEVTLSDVAKETQRLEIVGIKTTVASPPSDVDVVDDPAGASATEFPDELVDRLARRVCEALHVETDQAEVNYFGSSRGRGRGGRRGGQRGDRGRGGRGRGQQRTCWVCAATDHVARTCPRRYCRNCGQQGHDPWSAVCPRRL